jgi:hypothetical protein
MTLDPLHKAIFCVGSGLCIRLEVNFREWRMRLRGSEHTWNDYVLSRGLGCASTPAQERHDVFGKSLWDKDVRDVLLALEYFDQGVGQRRRHRLDVRFGWV